MLATCRRLVACSVLTVFIASFIPWRGGEPWGGLWVERVQAVPALLGTLSGKEWAWIVLAALFLSTLLFGRVFCSWLCPLGILQDVAARTARPRPQSRRGKGVRFAPNRPWLRATVALLAFGSLAVGSAGLLTWLDPYSIAARSMAAIANPLLSLLANALGAELPPPDWERYGFLFTAVAVSGLALPLALAVWRGRLYCNTLCPVGAVLGLLSRIAPFTPHLDHSACERCGACVKACKAQAIDVKNGRVDSTRCVACYDCLSACSRGAMKLHAQPRKEETSPAPAPSGPPDASRRSFLGLGISALAVSALPEAISSEPRNNIAAAPVPPGAQSVEHLLAHCTACGLCIANCPTQVLRPSLFSLGLSGFMKPTLDFTRSYCAPECSACSQTCPAGALLPLSLAEKRHTQIGQVHFQQAFCRVWKNSVACAQCVNEIQCPTGALIAQQVSVPTVLSAQCRGCRRCVRVCPAGAISMVEVDGRPKRLAVIDRSKCIGCGACASACRPRAIELASLTAPRLAHPEKCIGCGACEHICPTSSERSAALEVVPRSVHLTMPEA